MADEGEERPADAETRGERLLGADDEGIEYPAIPGGPASTGHKKPMTKNHDHHKSGRAIGGGRLVLSFGVEKNFIEPGREKQGAPKSGNFAGHRHHQPKTRLTQAKSKSVMGAIDDRDIFLGPAEARHQSRTQTHLASSTGLKVTRQAGLGRRFQQKWPRAASPSEPAASHSVRPGLGAGIIHNTGGKESPSNAM